MPPNWLARSFSQRGEAEVGGVLSKEAIDTFTEFFDAEDLNTIIDSFDKLCQMLDLVPGSYPGSFLIQCSADFFRIVLLMKKQLSFKPIRQFEAISAERYFSIGNVHYKLALYIFRCHFMCSEDKIFSLARPESYAPKRKGCWLFPSFHRFRGTYSVSVIRLCCYFCQMVTQYIDLDIRD